MLKTGKCRKGMCIVFAGLMAVNSASYGGVMHAAEPVENHIELPAYSLTPDSPEWSRMSYVEQLAACNLSEEQLVNLSTDDLLDLALDYPFAIDVLGFDTYEMGIEHLKATSNVYKLMFLRDDLKDAVINKYNDIDEEIQKMYLDVISGYLWNEGELDDTEKMSLFSLQSSDEEEVFGNFLIDALCNFGVDEEEVASYSSRSGYFVVISQGVSYNGATYSAGLYYDYGTSASCYKYTSGDYTPQQQANINSAFSGAHSGWVFTGTATRKYNNHSYCWIMQSTANTYWLPNPSNFMGATAYFTDNGADCAISNGDRIVIYSSSGIAHSAAARSASSGISAVSRMTTTTVESKFGSLGLYKTTLYDAYNYYSGVYYKGYT